MDNNKVPVDPQERAALIGKQIEMTMKMLAENQILDWGIFAGGGAGYTIAEGSESDVLKRVMQFTPHVKFKVQPVLSIQEVADVMKSMTG
jgi:hypothetical protein